MELSINDIMIYNSQAFVNDIQTKITENDQIVALGREASTILTQHTIPHLHIPHPSGLNRKLNDVKRVNKFLQECKEYVLQK